MLSARRPVLLTTFDCHHLRWAHLHADRAHHPEMSLGWKEIVRSGKTNSRLGCLYILSSPPGCENTSHGIVARRVGRGRIFSKAAPPVSSATSTRLPYSLEVGYSKNQIKDLISAQGWPWAAVGGGLRSLSQVRLGGLAHSTNHPGRRRCLPLIRTL